MAYTTLAQGASVTVTLNDQFDGLEVINRSQDLAQVALTTGTWSYGATPQQHSGRRVYQLNGAGSITLTATSGALQYELTDAADNRLAQSFSVAETSGLRNLVTASGNTLSLVKSTGYHCHMWSPNQQANDTKWYDYSGGLNDGSFQTHLTAAGAWANAGYLTQSNPTVASNLQLITIPALSWDYLGGESLFMFWRGMATPEGSEAPLMGDTPGASSANGVRVAVTTTGKMKVNAYQASGALSRFGGTSTSTVFEAAVEHSMAFMIDGVTGKHCYWADGARDATFGSGPLDFGSGGIIDALQSSNTFKVGGDGNTSASVQLGVACQHRALVILKGRRGLGAPAIASMDALVLQLHRNPQRLVSAAAW